MWPRVRGRGATKRKLVLKRGEAKTHWKPIDLGIFCISLTTINIRFHHEHGGQPCWHLLRSIQHQASPWHFTIFELKILQASNIFCPLEMPRLFWPSGFSGRSFHAFCPRVCLLRARVPSFGSSETTQIAGVLLMTRLGWTCIFSTLATGCLMSNLFDLSVLVSRSTQGVPDLHFSFTRKKKWVFTACKKNQVSDCYGELWLWFPSTETGNIAWASLTAVTAVSDSGSSKRWTKMWVKVSLRGPSTIISPWLHGLAHSANTWNKENRIPKTKCS